MKIFRSLGTLVAAAVVVAGCGGGGDGKGNDSPATTPDPDPVPVGEPIAGVWMGKMTWNDITHDHPYEWDTTEIVLPNGNYYHVFNHYFHFPTETQRNTMGGFAAGKVATAENEFRLEEAHEFSFINDFPDRPISGSWTYQSEKTVLGELAYDPRVQNGQDLTRAFSVNLNADYSVPARLEELRFNNQDHRSIQGVLWTQKSARADDSFKTPMHLVVNADGSLGSRYPEQCDVSGRLEPHSEVRVYEATVTLGANCPYPGYTFQGIAYLKDSYPTDTAPQLTPNRFHLVATNNDGGVRRGILFVQIVEGQIQPDEAPPAPGH